MNAIKQLKSRCDSFVKRYLGIQVYEFLTERWNMKKFFKGVMQHDAQDCGAACLTSILHFWGNNAPLSSIREEMKIDKSGTNLYTIGVVAEKYGLLSTALHGTFEELIEEVKRNSIKLPCIAHFFNNHSQGHFVVIYRCSGQKIKIFDPGEGKRTLSPEQFRRSWSGAVLTFDKTSTWKKNRQPNKTAKKIIGVVAKERKYFVLTIAYSLFVSLISMASAFFYKNVIDRMIPTTGSLTTFGGLLGQIVSNIDALLIVLVSLYVCQLVINLLNGIVLASQVLIFV